MHYLTTSRSSSLLRWRRRTIKDKLVGIIAADETTDVDSGDSPPSFGPRLDARPKSHETASAPSFTYNSDHSEEAQASHDKVFGDDANSALGSTSGDGNDNQYTSYVAD